MEAYYDGDDEKCQELVDRVANRFGVSKSERIAKEIEQLKKSKITQRANAVVAEEEIVARACEDMLSKSEYAQKVFESLSESEKKTLVDKIKDIIANIKDWIRDLLSL